MHHERRETVGKQSRSRTDVFELEGHDIGPADAGSQTVHVYKQSRRCYGWISLRFHIADFEIYLKNINLIISIT